MPEKSPKRKPTPFALTERQTETLKNWESAFGLAPKETAVLENCGLSLVYVRLAAGEYEAVKDGTRTKITVESIKRRRAGLARASYKPPSHKRSAPSQQQA